MAMFGDEEEEEDSQSKDSADPLAAPNHHTPTGPPARKRRRIDPTQTDASSTKTNEVNLTLPREAAAATSAADQEQKR
eukprot:CAMPEP_0198300710 /NCGR_PEP_ID=MMETSP1449-20131203/49142_1 /TAXON_ID=420275 /ORGANISM="Attheya septentrionalis, Strain CCMP2084" /LENGTH=77 /DNA_ID=CAMNT_0044002601 /DNA_START=1 /DNA_END=230 /DNA_ORIENTATION=-